MILHADVVGSTALVQRDERLAHENMQRAFRELASRISAYDGVVHEIRGDALVAEFERASDALCAALAFQVGRGSSPRGEDEDGVTPRLRIGVALGEVVIADRTVTGAGVVLAQRLEQLAEPGSVCVSAAVREAVPGRIPLAFHDRGSNTVKGFEDPVTVFAVAVATTARLPPPGRRALLRRIRRRWPVSLTVAGVVVTAAVLSWLAPWAPSRAPLGPEKPSVAVLPFQNMGEGGRDYFANGLTDDLITDLSKVSGLLVIARSSSFAFRGEGLHDTEIAEKLGVRYLVQGSVRRSGARVRVSAQLVDGLSAEQIWAERYDRELTDLFATQDELAQRIVSALAVRLTRSEVSTLEARRPPVFEAYELYLRARDGHLSHDQARMGESLALYQEAWTIDPEFARPYGGYARLATDIWRVGAVRDVLGASGALARATAEAAARRALTLDPTLPEAHLALALMASKDGAHEAALKAARESIELEPNNADAYTVLAIVEGFAGHPEAALASIETAARLNPRPPPYLTKYHGWVLLLNRRYVDAVDVLEPIAEVRDRGMEESPREFLAMAYARTGRLDAARAMVDSVLAQEPFLNLAYYRVAYDHFATSVDLAHQIESLEIAGVPEWPLGFSSEPEHRLRGAELQKIASGATWRGVDVTRQQAFVQEVGDAEETVYASPNVMLSGRLRIEADELCESFDGFLWGRALCGPVYRIHGDHDYVYVNPATLKRFSIEP